MTRTIRHYVSPVEIARLGEEEAILAALALVAEMTPGCTITGSTRRPMGGGIRLAITMETTQAP